MLEIRFGTFRPLVGRLHEFFVTIAHDSCAITFISGPSMIYIEIMKHSKSMSKLMSKDLGSMNKYNIVLPVMKMCLQYVLLNEMNEILLQFHPKENT